MTEDLTTAQAAIREKIENRLSIALDTNIWNFLARETSDEASKVKVLLKQRVAEGKVFCPVSFSLIAELLKQNYESALRTGALMEELSLNTAFALDDEIYRKEVRHFIQRFADESGAAPRRMPTEEIYVPVGGFAGMNFGDVTSAFDSLRLPESLKTGLVAKFEETLASLTITELIEKFKLLLPMSPLIEMTPPPAYLSMWRDRWEDAKGNKDKMREIELTAYVNNVLLPNLLEEKENFPAETRRRFIEYIKSLPQGNQSLASGIIIKEFPAIRNSVEIMTITGYDPNRKASMNDFFDIQNMKSPVAYADVLVATDKWVRHLLTNQTETFDDERAFYISSLTDFETYLQKL